ncbi:MAG TPA: hypothetical protein DIW17_02285 [Clostridiales bacterium]|nr:hypothetical protein [Clostridiales bacterium]
MYIYMTRHGETLWNLQGRTQGANDIPLTNRGIRQAEELAERLERESISQIYSSGLERAYKTAYIIGEKLGIKPKTRDELKEVNFGVWEGLSIKEIEENFPGQLKEYRANFDYDLENGENLSSLQTRIRHFADTLQNDMTQGEKRILLVAHAYPIRMLIMELMGLSKELLWKFQLSNGGISVIRTEPSIESSAEGWKSDTACLLCLNDTTHLYKHNLLQNCTE